MLDIKFVRENPEKVKENIKKKFQDKKLGLVDEVIALDSEYREVKVKADNYRKDRNEISDKIGNLMREGKKEEGLSLKEQVVKINEELKELEERETVLEKDIKEIMYQIPNMKSFNGLDKEAAARVSGNGFYYVMGDIARLHSAVLAYARDFMIDKGFTYCIPPFMIRSDAVNGVMSFEEKEAMMYKIEGEDLYLIGTSEHSMIAKFKGELLKEENLPITMTSYSPCFRKEVGAHGIEERGVYRVHQFEKQEMIVICKPEESKDWYEKMWKYTVELFRSLDIPVRTLECCSGDLADLKYKSVDVEAWSPRQKTYFEVGSCSNLTDAQARRLGIRYKNENGEKVYAHTLNNTVLTPPRMLIAFLENNYNEDGSINIPVALRPYMGGKEKIEK